MRFYCSSIFMDTSKGYEEKKYLIIDRKEDRVFDLSEDEVKQFVAKEKIENISIINDKVLTVTNEYLANADVRANLFAVFYEAYLDFFKRNNLILGCNNEFRPVKKEDTQRGWGIREYMLYMRAPILSRYYGQGSSHGPVIMLSLRFHIEDRTFSGVLDTIPISKLEDSIAPWEKFSNSKQLYRTKRYKDLNVVLKNLSENLVKLKV